MPKAGMNNPDIQLKNINDRLLSLERRVGTLEGRQSKQIQESAVRQAEPSGSKGMKIAGWILIGVGVFFVFILSVVFGIIGRSFMLRLFFGPLGWIAIIVGVILLIVSGKSGKKSEAKETKGVPNYEEVPKQKTTKKAVSSQNAEIVHSEKSEISEANIGMKWFARIGIVSLVLSVAFFIVYAIQNRMIGPTGQIALGIFIGIVLLILGELFNRKEKYIGYARTLTGGGFAILYFAIYAAYHFYKLIPSQWLDLVILSIIILFAILFSTRYKSQVIAGEAFLLGYLAPIIIGNMTIFSLIYSVFLSIGLVFLCYIKGWRNLSFGGLIFSYIIHGMWLGSNWRAENLSIIHGVFIIIYVAIYTILAVFIKAEKEVKKEKSTLSQVLIYVSFALGYLFFFFVELDTTMLASLIILIFGVVFLTYREKINLLPLVALIGTFVTQWIWLGRRYTEENMPAHMVFSTIYLVMFCIVAFLQEDNIQSVITQLVNSFFYLGLMLIPMRKFYPDMDGLFCIGISVFYIVLGYISYMEDRKYAFNTFVFLCLGYLTLAIPLQLNQNWVSFSWAIGALLVMLLSFRLKEDILRLLSTIIAGLVVFKLLAYDSWALGRFKVSDLMSSSRSFSFLIVIIILYVMSYIYSKNKKMFDNYDSYVKYVAVGLSIAATFLTTFIFTIEIMQSGGIGEMKQMWVSVVWIIQALVILIYGFAASKRVARIIGIVIFFISIFKIFLYDLRMLDTIYRIISFFVLGIILLLAAFLYYKFKDYI